MLKKIMLVIVLFCFLETAYSTNYIEEWVSSNENLYSTEVKEKFEQIEKHAVSVLSVKPGLSLCSGTLIYYDEYYSYVLTCKHCLSMNENVYVENKKVIKMITSPKEDLMLLIADGNFENKTPAKLAFFNAIRGEDLYFVAYPYLKKKSYKQLGQVWRNTIDWGWATMKSIGGCSGSGIYNDKIELVGVLWGGNGEDLSVYEKLSDIKDFLYNINFKVK